VGDLCLRCHTPFGWLEGRSTPTDGSALTAKDRDGVSCHFCHRLVDPIYDPMTNPVQDVAILASIGQIPTDPHSGQYIIDPDDNRRAPLDLDPNFYLHPWLKSPYHEQARLCGTCHDVSNPVYVRQPDGTYAPGALNAPHPTQNKLDEFPIERTFSEWSASAFAAGPVDVGGRFGGTLPAVSACQDCHMPATEGRLCAPGLPAPTRTDVPQHDFNGSNTWVLNAVRSLYPDSETGLDDAIASASNARVLSMLERASDLELRQAGANLFTRVINQTGHKLPTGYPEGRRMWVNVRFFDGSGTLMAERGAYDTATATLTTGDTKVYEAHLGLDELMSTVTGLPVGVGFHFAVNNKWFFDIRIPPRGFTNAAFEAVQAKPVGYDYADGQYWDDTRYPIPQGARRAEVRVYFQTTTKEYIEFLRDANTTNAAGIKAYNQWVLQGKSEPALLDYASIALGIPSDLNHDGRVDLTDLALLLANFGGNGAGDVDGDGDVDLSDLAQLLAVFGTHV